MTYSTPLNFLTSIKQLQNRRGPTTAMSWRMSLAVQIIAAKAAEYFTRFASVPQSYFRSPWDTCSSTLKWLISFKGKTPYSKNIKKLIH